MPTYNFGYPEWNSYLVVPLAQAQERGLYNGNEMLNEVKQRFTEYDSSVKVVDYLDDTPNAE